LALYNSGVPLYNRNMSNTAPEKTALGRGYAIALTSALVLSTTAIFIRYLTQTYDLPALVLAFWRDVFVTLTILAVLGLVRPALMRVGRGQLPFLAIYGLVLALFNSLWTLSVSLNGAAVSTVLAYCSAGFTALLGWWLLKERLDWGKGLAVAASLGGCVLVSGAYEKAAWGANVVGILTGILSGLFYAIYSLMGRSASQRGLNPWSTLLFTFGFAAIFLWILNMVGRGILPGAIRQAADFLWLGDSWKGWGILFLLAAGPTLAGFGLYNVSLAHLPSSVANLIVSSEPAFTVVIAYVFLGERMNWAQISGGLLILGGVVFLRVYEGWLAGKTMPEPEAAGLSVIE
jgi:drug/metabolite transporter (DMT)-like permease